MATTDVGQWIGNGQNGSDASNASATSGYGGGGGGGSTGPTAEQERAQGNLGGIAGYNAQTTLNAAGQADKVYDISDQQNAYMRGLSTTQAKHNAGNDWYTQQQKLQNVTAQLADASGNAMNGSFLYDFWDAVARKDDMDDVAVLNQMRQNINEIDKDYWEAVMATNNGRNEMYMDTERNLREIAADYAAQSNNIHPDLANGLIDADGHTITPPSWLQTSYFDKHVRGPLKPDEVSLFRPANAAATAEQKGLTDKDTSSQHESSGNMDYWTRMHQGYGRRTQ